MKLFLTGDNHIGLKYASHPQAECLAQKRITAFEAMVRAANAEECGLFVIAGDLFENTYSIAKRDIKALLEILSGFCGTVVILPGNHDYYDKDVKLWQCVTDAMKSYDNILLLTENRPYTLMIGEETATLYPALCTSVHSAPGENNLGWIKSETVLPDDTYRIGIAHGAVEGQTIDREGQYFLMRREELEQIPMDVWLLGHTHVPFPYDLKEDRYTEGERIFNAGTHVQTDVSCGTEGRCLIVEITPNKTVRAKKLRSGNLRFVREEVCVSAGNMKRELAEVLAPLGDDTVVDLILTGAVTAEEYESRETILEELLSRFLEGSCSDHGLSRLISEELICAEFPETSFSAGLLRALMEEPKEAQLTYELLKTLREGK